MQLVSAANYHLAQLDNEALDELWLDGLTRTAAAGVHPAVEGLCVRILSDRERLTPDAAARHFSRALSRSRGAGPVAQWIHGFLFGSGKLLLHHPPLFALIDEWVAGLDWEDFESVVALLRRTFSDFSRYDRERLMALVTVGDAKETLLEAPADQASEDPLVGELLRWIA